MINAIISRGLQTLAVLWVISLVSYLVQVTVTPMAGPANYGEYLAALVRGDLGESLFYKAPALDIILQKFPATLELVLGTGLLIGLVAVPAGVYTALAPRHWLARGVMAISLLGISLPVFLSGTLLVYLFAVELNWLPVFGRGPVIWLGGWPTGLTSVTGLQHLLLPCSALALTLLPLFIRLIRAEMLIVLASKHVLYARAMGLAPWRIWLRYGLRNALLPLVTMSGLQFGTLMAYALVVENLFQWPGMGFLFMEAVTRSDGPLMAAYILVAGGIFLLTNIITDLIYGLIDPRLAPWNRDKVSHETI
ncbi:MAG: ABC transporter permease [Gammaproteobacteria bacterium]|nr:ABC transporter permease [Gammaproteobacteria bacterium]